jgi:hypothetical protein
MRLQHTGKFCEPNLVSTLVPMERGNIDGEILKRVLAAGSESDKYREKYDNHFFSKIVFTNMTGREEKRRQVC